MPNARSGNSTAGLRHGGAPCGRPGRPGAVVCVDPDTGVAFAYAVAPGPWPGTGEGESARWVSFMNAQLRRPETAVRTAATATAASRLASPAVMPPIRAPMA